MNSIYLTLFLISSAILAFQVALTRFFALAQGHHFAFMAISLALLGAGASGTYLSLRQPTPATWRRTLAGGAILFTISLPAAYLTTNYLPFDAYRLAWEPTQLLWLSLYFLVLTIPFFFGGMVIGTVLSIYSEQAGWIYAVNLLGSGLGPPLALLTLATVGGPGTVILCALLGWLAVIAIQLTTTSPHPLLAIDSQGLFTKPRLKMGASIIITLGLLYLTFRPPPAFDVRLTPYKPLSQAQLYPGSEIIFSEWNAISRVDVVQSEGIRSAPGLSFTYPGQLPRQLGLMIDGDNLSPISEPSQSGFTRYLPISLAFELRPRANVLILEPGGGLSVLAAQEHGAEQVTVVQSNPTALAAVHHYAAGDGKHLYDNENVTIIVDEPRSFLRRTVQEFDLIILPLTDSFHPVTAGAYTLGEDYRYTVEALSDMLAHLSPDGLIVVERWLQLPPSESLRLWATTIEALRQTAPRADPASHLLILRTLQTSLTIGSHSPLSSSDLKLARDFVARLQYDLVWLPEIQPEEANRFSVVADAAYYRVFTDLLTTPDATTFYASYKYAVAPPTDDYPFFFHFFKWTQTPEILQSLGTSWQPFGGSGYLVLVVLLILVAILSAVLILLPLFWQRNTGHVLNDKPDQPSTFANHSSSFHKFRHLLYFTFLGLGFLFVEIPLLQRFILYLGQPVYSFAVVVSAILVAAGLGSGYLSQRFSLKIILPLIVLLTVAYPFLLPLLFEATLRLSFAGRIVVAMLVLFPLGALLGIPFPRGLTLVGETSPSLVPWVWAVNGCASVVSAVAAAMIALTWGFSAVLWGAGIAYGLAGLVIWPLLPRKGYKPYPTPIVT